MISKEGSRVPRKIRSLDLSKMRFFKVSATYFAVQTILSVLEVQSPIRIDMSTIYLFLLFLFFTWYGVSFYFLLNP